MEQTSFANCLLTPEIEAQARRDRLQRLREVLVEQEIGAALLFDSINLRYACGVVNMQLNTSRNPGRYVFVPAEGPVVLFEYAGCQHLSADIDTVNEVRDAHAIHPQYCGYGLKYLDHLRTFANDIAALMMQHSPENNRIAVDRPTAEATPALQSKGLVVCDGNIPADIARSIKSPAELELVKASMRCTEAAVAHMEQNLIPGRSEMEVWSSLWHALVAGGGEYIETRLFNSGPRTNPWFQETSAKIIEAGELVALDTDAIGPHGYYSDFSRTFLAGDGPASGEQRTLYGHAFDQIEHNMSIVRPGMSFQEFSEKSWVVPDEYLPHRYLVVVHGMGLAGEHPILRQKVDWDSMGTDGIFEPNMTLCFESFIGREDGHEGVKLEEHVLLTDKGIERLSSYGYDDRLAPV